VNYGIRFSGLVTALTACLLRHGVGTDFICQPDSQPAIKTRSSPAAFSTALSVPFFPSPLSPITCTCTAGGCAGLVSHSPPLPTPTSTAVDPDSFHLSIRPSSTFLDLPRPSSTFLDLPRPSSTSLGLSADGVIAACLPLCVTWWRFQARLLASSRLASPHPRWPSSTTSHSQCRLPFHVPRAEVSTYRHGDWPPHCGMTASSAHSCMQSHWGTPHPQKRVWGERDVRQSQ
jgi:hypothetical protein